MENATLDLPGIDESMLASTAAPVAPRTEVATAAAGAIDLDKLDLRTLALAKFGLWRKQLDDATKKLSGTVHDLSTQSKIDDAKSLRQRLINAPLADARKVSKGLKSKLKSVSEDVGAELELIEAGFVEAAKLITPQIEAREAELAAEKVEREAKEAARRQVFEDKVSAIRGYLAMAQGLPSVRIEKGVAHLTAMVIGDEWAEFKDIAKKAVDETMASLRALLAKTQAEEVAAAERERLRLENERVAADLVEQKRQLDEQRADLKRQADELAAALEAARVQAAREKYDEAEQEQRRQAAMAEHAAHIEREQRDRQEDENKTIESIWYHARRIEGNRVGYVQKAIGYFESGAGTYTDDPRPNVAAAVQQARAEMQEKLRLAAEREREEHEAEALAQAKPVMITPIEEAMRPDCIVDFVILEQGGNAPTALVEPATIVWDYALGRPVLKDDLPSPAINASAIAVSLGFAPLVVTPEHDSGPTQTPAQALALHALEAFNTKFPSQPKPSIEWWAELRRLAGEVAA